MSVLTKIKTGLSSNKLITTCQDYIPKNTSLARAVNCGHTGDSDHHIMVSSSFEIQIGNALEANITEHRQQTEILILKVKSSHRDAKAESAGWIVCCLNLATCSSDDVQHICHSLKATCAQHRLLLSEQLLYPSDDQQLKHSCTSQNVSLEFQLSLISQDLQKLEETGKNNKRVNLAKILPETQHQPVLAEDHYRTNDVKVRHPLKSVENVKRKFWSLPVSVTITKLEGCVFHNGTKEKQNTKTTAGLHYKQIISVKMPPRYMVRIQGSDKIHIRVTPCRKSSTSGHRNRILLCYVQTQTPGYQQHFAYLGNEARKKLLLHMMNSFFDFLHQSVWTKLASQREPFWFRYNRCQSIAEKQVMVYMMHGDKQQLPRQPHKTGTTGQLNNSQMHKEILRYGTFEQWPKSAAAWPNRLAGAGFFYRGHGDEVVCYSCGVVCSRWQFGMSPMEVHKRLAPTCSFITNGNGNIPIIEDVQAREHLVLISGIQPAPSPVSSGYHSMLPQACPDVRGAYERSPSALGTTASPADSTIYPSLSAACSTHMKPAVNSNMSSSSVSRQEPSTEARQMTQDQYTQSAQRSVVSDYSGTLGINTDRPLYPSYAVTMSRKNTFGTGWPQSHKQTPEDLAEAGFFYSGHGDSVRCFFCGTGLRNWDTGDNPWVEHARWSPQCVYLNQHQGLAFVTLVQELSAGNNQVEYQQVLNILKDTPGTSATPALKQDASSTTGSTEEEENSKSGAARNSSVHHHQDDSLAEENECLKQQTVCKICLDKEVTIVFLPCGHLVCCAECAPALRKCPMCRTDVKGTVRAYMG